MAVSAADRSERRGSAALAAAIAFAAMAIGTAEGWAAGRTAPGGAILAQAQTPPRPAAPRPGKPSTGVEVDLSVIGPEAEKPPMAAAPPAPLNPAGRGAEADPMAGWSAEALFAEGYRLEQAGQVRDAQQVYDRLILRYPGSPLATIGVERLNALRKLAALPRALTVGDYACSAPGLFANEARWCGVVRQENREYLLVEVFEIRLGTMFATGFNRALCTGDQFLGYFDHGKRIWVPRTCMAERP